MNSKEPDFIRGRPEQTFSRYGWNSLHQTLHYPDTGIVAKTNTRIIGKVDSAEVELEKEHYQEASRYFPTADTLFVYGEVQGDPASVRIQHNEGEPISHVDDKKLQDP